MIKRDIDVTKVFEFESAHKLNNYEGDCQYLHGHTYKLEVTFRGQTDENGLVIDFKEVKDLVNKNIISIVDHAYLNDLVKFNPTCENLTEWIFEILENKTNNEEYSLQKIKLWETSSSYSSLSREQYDVKY